GCRQGKRTNPIPGSFRDGNRPAALQGDGDRRSFRGREFAAASPEGVVRRIQSRVITLASPAAFHAPGSASPPASPRPVRSMPTESQRSLADDGLQRRLALDGDGLVLRIVVWICFMVPGVVHALLVVSQHQADQRNKVLMKAIRVTEC